MESEAHTLKDQHGEPLGVEPGKQRLDLCGKDVGEITSMLVGAPSGGDGGIADPLSDALPIARRSPTVAPAHVPAERTPVCRQEHAPPDTPGAGAESVGTAQAPEPSGFADTPAIIRRVVDAPHVAPGRGGPDLDLQPPKARPFESEIAVEDLAHDLPPGPSLAAPPIKSGQSPMVARFRRMRFVAISAAIVVISVALVTFANELRTRSGDISAMVRPLFEDPYRARTPTRLPRLVVKAQKGFVNEPLPLGVSIHDASDGEWLFLAGLVMGTTLSGGTPLGATSWQLSAREIGNALVYPPKDFVGLMAAAIDLRSSADWLIDSQTVWFEWVPTNADRSAPQLER